MRKKKFIWRIGVPLLVLFYLQGASLAQLDKTFFIDGADIRRAGSDVTITNNGNFEFFLNGAPMVLYVPRSPGDPLVPITDFAIRGGDVDTKGSSRGRNVMARCERGETLSVRVWTPAIGLGNYYNSPSALPMNSANWGEGALLWNWNNLPVDYKAAAPYQPTISEFREQTSHYTDGRASRSTLTVMSQPGSGTDGLREVNSYSWRFWEPADPSSPAADEPSGTHSGATGANLSLSVTDVTAGHTYAFRVNHANSWVSEGTWSTIYTYTVAEGGTGISAIVTDFSLVHPADSLGVNMITFPFSSVSDPGAITTAQELIEAVNRVPGRNVVTTLSWWDSATQASAGYIVTYSSDTVNEFGTITAIGTANADPTLQTLSRDMAYQLYVTENVDLRLIGAR